MARAHYTPRLPCGEESSQSQDATCEVESWAGGQGEAGQKEREVARRVLGWKCPRPQPSLELELRVKE